MTTPFRPSAADLARIGHDVAPIAAIQQKLVANHPHLTVPDRRGTMRCRKPPTRTCSKASRSARH